MRERRACFPTSTDRRCCGPSSSTTDARPTLTTLRTRDRAQPGRAVVRGGAGRARRRRRVTVGRAAPRARRATARTGARAGRGEHRRARPGGRPRRRRLVLARARGAAPRRDVERADLAAHRTRSGPSDGARAARDSCARCRRPRTGIVGRLRHTARALGVAWPSGATYADVVRGLRPDTRARATFLLQALHALRGAGYAVVTPGAPTPIHAAVGAPYAHVTAPLRRLADRFANEVVLAVAGGYRTSRVGGRRAAWSRRGDATLRPARGRGRSCLRRRGGDGGARGTRRHDVPGHGGRPSPPRGRGAAHRRARRRDRGAGDHPPLGDVGDGQARRTGSGGADV